jgi:hypothetical protein
MIGMCQQGCFSSAWCCLEVAPTAQLLASHKVDNTPADIADLIDQTH